MNIKSVIILCYLFLLFACNTSQEASDSTAVQDKRKISISPDSMFVLGYDYLMSGENLDSALYWLSMASEKGNDNATFHLGQTYLFGYGESIDGQGNKTGIRKDEKRGEELLLSLSEKNSTLALSSLAQYYLSAGNNSAKAIEFLKRGEVLNDPQLMFELGYLYYYGTSYGSKELLNVNLKKEKGIELFIKAADLKYLPAVYQIGVMYIEGNSYIKRDSQKAKYYLELLLNQEDLNQEIGIDKADIEALMQKME